MKRVFQMGIVAVLLPLIAGCASLKPTPTPQELSAYEELMHLSKSQLINDFKQQFEGQCTDRNIVPTICECSIKQVTNTGVIYKRSDKFFTHKFSMQPIFRQGGAWYFIKNREGTLDGIMCKEKTMALEIYHILTALYFKFQEEPLPSRRYIPRLNATATALRFFEGDKSPPKKRNYTSRFSKWDIRYIWWELEIRHPGNRQRVNFHILVGIHKPNGTVLKFQTLRGRIEPNWTISRYAGSSSRRVKFMWERGDYRVDVYIDGQEVASGGFTVY